MAEERAFYQCVAKVFSPIFSMLGSFLSSAAGRRDRNLSGSAVDCFAPVSRFKVQMVSESHPINATASETCT